MRNAAIRVDAGEIEPDVDPRELMRGLGSLCIGADGASGHDPGRLVRPLIAGLGRR